MALNPCPECGNMVSDTATNCPKCGYNLTLIKKETQPLPPPNYVQPNVQPKKPIGCLKIGAIIFGVMLFILVLGGIASECSSNKENNTNESKNVVDTVSIKEKTQEDLALENLTSIEREIATIKKGIDFSNYRGSIAQLQIELVMFGVWAKTIENAKPFEANTAKANELKKLVQNIQKKEFPILRKEYAKESSKIMWEHDVEITSTSNHSILNITGGVFAANKNKKEFQEKISTAVREFRFKQVRYRWYEGEDEYTFYDVFDGNDSDLMQF